MLHLWVSIERQKLTMEFKNGNFLSFKKAQTFILATTTLFSVTTNLPAHSESITGGYFSGQDTALINHYNKIQEIKDSTFKDNTTAVNNINNTLEIIQNTIFENNKVAILNEGDLSDSLEDGHINNIVDSTFKNNQNAIQNGSQNHGYIGYVKGNFIENGNNGTIGAAIYNGQYLGSHFLIDKIDASTFKENSAKIGGAIYNEGTIGVIYGTEFTKNKAEIGGAIYNEGADNEYSTGTARIDLIVNSSFTENKADIGAAIYSKGDIHLKAENGGKTIISNNTKLDGSETSAIYMGIKSETLADIDYFYDAATDIEKEIKIIQQNGAASLTLEAVSGGIVEINDKISGDKSSASYQVITEMKYDDNKGDYIILSSEKIYDTENQESYSVKITGDSTGKVVLNNDVENGANISLDTTTLHLGARDNVLRGDNLTLNSGTLDLINNTASNMDLNKLSLTSHVKTTADVDLKNEVMDRINAKMYSIKEDSLLDVVHLNLISETEREKTVILYADKELAQNVQYTGENTVSYSPIYKYTVSYDISEDEKGYFTFSRGAGNKTSDFNPSVFASSAASTAGAYTTQLGVFDYAFRHSDAFMNLNSMQRVAASRSNQYAQGAIVDSEVFSPLYTKLNEQGAWFRPYTNFESIPLKNGPKVTNISYGALVGYDSDLKDLSHGFKGVGTLYLGYNGASQHYDGINTTLNGGLLGVTGTLYKGKFFNATTVSVGGGAAISDTMYGKDTYPYLMAGVANKFGYNIEFKDGKVILQPNFLFSYSFVNTFDYTNAANVRIKSDALNAFQVAPGAKLIFNTKNGWQPYLSAAMIWNINDKQKVSANNIELPQVSIKPYVQYGVGVQKLFKQDKITAWGQALVTNGGINGVGLSAGVRFLLGREKKK